MWGMIEAAGECGITLHRAFDVSADPIATLQKTAEFGIDTILTSGQEADCLAGRRLLRHLVHFTDENMEAPFEKKCRQTILVGAGVNASNIAEIVVATGARAFHMSGKKILSSGMCYRNERVHMGVEGLSEFEIYRTDKEEIRRAAEILNKLFIRK